METNLISHEKGRETVFAMQKHYKIKEPHTLYMAF